MSDNISKSNKDPQVVTLNHAIPTIQLQFNLLHDRCILIDIYNLYRNVLVLKIIKKNKFMSDVYR